MSIKTCKQHANEPIFIYAECAACEIQRYRNEVQSLKAENESLRGQLEYADEQVVALEKQVKSLIRAAISSPENH